MELLCLIVTVYLVICFVRVVLSWLPDEGGGILSAVSTISYTLTEPLFATFRNILPRPGDLPLDLAPMVVIFLLFMVRGLVCSL